MLPFLQAMFYTSYLANFRPPQAAAMRIKYIKPAPPPGSAAQPATISGSAAQPALLPFHEQNNTPSTLVVEAGRPLAMCAPEACSHVWPLFGSWTDGSSVATYSADQPTLPIVHPTSFNTLADLRHWLDHLSEKRPELGSSLQGWQCSTCIRTFEILIS